MAKVYKTKLWVNKKPIAINPFVEDFLAQTSLGAVSSLRGAEYIQSLEVHQKKGNVEIKVNGADIPLTPFPNDIISNTLMAMVSSLKEVGDIESIDISVDAK
jgi:hypothetical protein